MAAFRLDYRRSAVRLFRLCGRLRYLRQKLRWRCGFKSALRPDTTASPRLVSPTGVAKASLRKIFSLDLPIGESSMFGAGS